MDGYSKNQAIGPLSYNPAASRRLKPSEPLRHQVNESPSLRHRRVTRPGVLLDSGPGTGREECSWFASSWNQTGDLTTKLSGEFTIIYPDALSSLCK